MSFKVYFQEKFCCSNCSLCSKFLNLKVYPSRNFLRKTLNVHLKIYGQIMPMLFQSYILEPQLWKLTSQELERELTRVQWMMVLTLLLGTILTISVMVTTMIVLIFHKRNYFHLKLWLKERGWLHSNWQLFQLLVCFMQQVCSCKPMCHSLVKPQILKVLIQKFKFCIC
jgi:hypothetical protein